MVYIYCSQKLKKKVMENISGVKPSEIIVINVDSYLGLIFPNESKPNYAIVIHENREMVVSIVEKLISVGVPKGNIKAYLNIKDFEIPKKVWSNDIIKSCEEKAGLVECMLERIATHS